MSRVILQHVLKLHKLRFNNRLLAKYTVKHLSFHLPKMSCDTQRFEYPLARRDSNIVDDYHGEKVADPYRWLEDPDSDETKKYVDALNAVSEPFLQGCALRNQIEKRITEQWDFPKYSCPWREGDHYYYYYNTGLQNQSVLYTLPSLDAEPRVFLDPNLLSEDGTTSINTSTFSEDGSLFAYGLSEKGSDWVTVRVKRAPSSEDLPDVLHKLRYTSLSFTHDNKGFFYTKFRDTADDAVGTSTQKNEYHTLYYHYLGTDQSEDPVCFDFPDKPDYFIDCDITEDGKYLLLKINDGCSPENMVFYCDLESQPKIAGRINLTPLIDTFEATYGFIFNHGPVFMFRTNLNAPLFKLITVDLGCPSMKNWKVVIQENQRSKLDWAKLVHGDKLLVNYMEDVKDALYLHDWQTGAQLYKFPLDIGQVTGVSGRRKLSQIFYKFESFLIPAVTYHCDLAEPSFSAKVFRKAEVKDFNPDKFECKQVFYESKDGTKIPMFLVHRKGMEMSGDNFTLLYGYGGFNISLQPFFSVSRLAMVEKMGGIFALANIRGGSEYGQKWHKAAIKENKQKSFDDFIAAAEYLIRSGYTSSKRLVIEGGSNGGMMVAACAQQRPELFAAVIDKVGVHDMFRFHKFTVGAAWVSDFGCADNAEDFKTLKKYSPLHNLKTPESAEKQYPAMLLCTADHDDRVSPLHSLKYIAQLYQCVKECPYQKNPLLIRVEVKAGHGAGKPIKKVIEELRDVYCFIARILNLEWQEN